MQSFALTTVHRRSISRALGFSAANVFHPMPDSPFPFSPGGPGGPWGPIAPLLPTGPNEHEKDE